MLSPVDAGALHIAIVPNGDQYAHETLCHRDPFIVANCVEYDFWTVAAILSDPDRLATFGYMAGRGWCPQCIARARRSGLLVVKGIG